MCKAAGLGRNVGVFAGDGVEVSREERRGILQEALSNYARRVDQADGVEVRLPENRLGNPLTLWREVCEVCGLARATNSFHEISELNIFDVAFRRSAEH